MNFILAKCPSCGGNLEIPDNKEFVKCDFCESTVKVREAISFSELQKIGNYIEIAYNAIDAENYEEALEYCNRVLELDIKNFRAWKVKTLVSLYSSDGYEYKLKEGLQYYLKAYSYGALEEKIEIEELMIQESLSDKYSENGIDHIDFLFELFKETGSRDSRIMIKIIDITDKAIYNNVAFGESYFGEMSQKNIEAMDKLKLMGQEVYDTVFKDSNDRYKRAVTIRKGQLKIVEKKAKTEYINKALFPWFISVFFLLGLSATLGTDVAIVMVIVTLGLSYIIFEMIKTYARNAASEYEKNRYGSNIVY